MAGLRRATHSPFWIATLRAWIAVPSHPKGGFWRKTDRSTKVPLSEPRKAAQRVADEMERIARELLETPKPDREFWESRLAALMRASNVPPPIKRTNWLQSSQQWLSGVDASPKSLQKYEGEIGQFSKFLGIRARHDLRSITDGDLMTFYKSLMADGLAAGTAANTTKTIKSVLHRAHLVGHIETNPGALVVLKGGPSGTRKPFTRQDVAAILAHIDARESPEWRIACLFGLYYGMRIGDAVSRGRSEISIEDGIKIIRFVPQKKARRGRAVTLPLVGELADLKPGKGPITPKLAKLMSPSKAFGSLLDRMGLARSKAKTSGRGRAVSDKSFHSFRHTANSLMVDAGVDPRVRQLICDHEDADVAAGYTHASLETMAAAIAKAARL